MEATLEILGESGVKGWTAATLSKRVGVSDAALFKHFSSMDEILESALELQAKRLRARVEGYDASGSGWSAIEGLALDVLAFMQATGGGPLLVLVTSQVPPSMRAHAGRAIGAFRARVLAFCEASDALSAEAATVADLAVALVQSCTLRWLLAESPEGPPELAKPMLELLGRTLI